MYCLNCKKTDIGYNSHGTAKIFCDIQCETAWYDHNPKKPYGTGVEEWIEYNREMKHREVSIIKALQGDREAKRILRQRWKLRAIYDRENQREVRL